MSTKLSLAQVRQLVKGVEQKRAVFGLQRWQQACADCGDVTTVTAVSAAQARQRATAAGWQFRVTIGGSHLAVCPDCVQRRSAKVRARLERIRRERQEAF